MPSEDDESAHADSENHSDADREDKPDRSWTQLSRAQHIELENQLSSSRSLQLFGLDKIRTSTKKTQWLGNLTIYSNTRAY
ncbi:7980_t:CDS:2 [Rhizophagus irregularis]|nr:7980_t:CDS:2 [Rhizophagus irregularis]